MPLHRLRPVLLALVVGACAAPDPEASAPVPDAAGFEPRACDEGLVRNARGDCVPAEPGVACPAGTLPLIGAGTCEPVGWTACGDGFERDPSGWGCTPVLAESCGEFELAVPGSPACLPIGDCDAPFPPPGTELLVDDDFTAAQLDGRHFRDLNLAIQAAPDGALIAIDEGDYLLELGINRPLRIVGRCPARVRLFNGEADRPAVHVNQARVELSGVTVSGSDPGIAVERGGTLLLRDAVVAGNVTYGLYAFGGSTLFVEDVLVRGTLESPIGGGAGIAIRRGSRAELTRVEVRDSRAMGVVVHETFTVSGVAPSLLATDLLIRNVLPSSDAQAIGLLALDTGIAELRGAVVERAGQIGLAVDGPGSRLTVSGTMVRESGATPATSEDVGVLVQNGASLEGSRLAIVRSSGAGVLAHNPGSHVALADSIVRLTRPRLDGRADGVNVSFGASGDLRSVALVETGAVALYVGIDDASLRANRLFVTGTRGDFHGNSRGVSVENATAELAESAILQFSESGLLVGGTGTVATLDRVLIAEVSGATDRGAAGGIIAIDNGSVRMRRSIVRDTGNLCLAFSASSGLLDASAVSGCGAGLHLQNGSVLRAVDAALVEVGSRVVAVTSSVTFTDLGARVGTGNLALPEVLGK